MVAACRWWPYGNIFPLPELLPDFPGSLMDTEQVYLNSNEIMSLGVYEFWIRENSLKGTEQSALAAASFLPWRSVQYMQTPIVTHGILR